MSISRVAALSIVMTSVASLAIAQQAGPPADHGRWDPTAMREHMEARRAERAKALHDVLAIQPGQEQAFAAFISAMHPSERDRDGGRGPDPRDETRAREAMTTPERLDRMKAEMDRRFAAMREAFDRRALATRTLYAALDPRQRAAMDALPELRGGHGGGMGHGDRMGRHGPMGAGPTGAGM